MESYEIYDIKNWRVLTQTGSQHDNNNQTIYLKMNAVPI